MTIRSHIGYVLLVKKHQRLLEVTQGHTKEEEKYEKNHIV